MIKPMTMDCSISRYLLPIPRPGRKGARESLIEKIPPYIKRGKMTHFGPKIFTFLFCIKERPLRVFNIFTFFILFISHCWEENNFTYGCLIRKEHDEPIHAHTDTACRWHTIFKRFNEISIHLISFFIAELFGL